MNKNYFQKTKIALRVKGFALLFAILASSILLLVSIAIWNIAFREVILSSFGRESQSAFYIADSAMECAFYWDLAKTNTFATSTDSTKSAESLTCGGNTVPISVDSKGASSATSHFQIDFSGGRATVYIQKTNPNGNAFSLTNIESHGQNSVNVYEPTLVERGLKSNY